ncbi:hypothetical protein MC885_010186 [Smutsia gigantea]|nr:hypothetical protein MC885_010186 [Smutsia gigantea]
MGRRSASEARARTHGPACSEIPGHGGKTKIKKEEKPLIFSKTNPTRQFGFRVGEEGLVANYPEERSSYPAGKERHGVAGLGAHPLTTPGGPLEALAREIGDYRSAPTSCSIRRTFCSASERRQYEPVLTSARWAKPLALSRYLRLARAATLPSFCGLLLAALTALS